MKLPSRAEWQLLALVVLLSWPMQLHAKHIPGAHPLAIPGFAMLVYLAWPLASLALIHGTAKRLAGAWLASAAALTVWMSATGAWKTWRAELLVLGSIGAATAWATFFLGGLRAGDFGLGPGEWRRWGPLAIVGMGVAVVLVWIGAALSPELVGFYPVYRPARSDPGALLGWELAMIAYMVCWESLWRGTMLYGARRALSDTGAVAMQAIPFFVLHFEKPELEMATSILGGLFLGWFCLWARSCWPAALWHATLYVAMEMTGAAVRSWG